MDKKRLFKIAAIVLLCLASITFLCLYGHKVGHLKLWHIKKFVLSYGKLSIFVIFLIYALKPLVVFFPIFVVSMAAGNIYGPVYGALINLVGAFLSGTVAFFIARFLGKDFVDSIIRGKALKIDDDIEKHGFKILLLMRLNIIFPFDLLSYAAGLTKIRYKDFILGTMIGIIPEAVSYSLTGHNLSNPLSVRFMLPFLTILIIAIIFSVVLRKTKNNT